MKVNGGLTRNADGIGLDFATVDPHEAGHLARVRRNNNSPFMKLK
jgi:hypothetical protein